MPTLVVRYPDGSESEHELYGDLRIGRQEGNDLILTEGGVSRQHARVFIEGSKVLLEDLSSANGTYVDGERITDVVVLTAQTQVVLGDYELRIKGGARPSGGQRRGTRAAEPADGPKATRAMPTLKPARPPGSGLAKAERSGRNSGADRPMQVQGIDDDPPPRMSMGGPTTPVLRGLTGPWANMLYPIKTKVVVGRTPPAVVLLEDDSISRKHAELERTGRGVMLRDLGSANGTLLNGERLGQEPVQLSPGDIVQFGMVELVYESNEQAGKELGRRVSGSPAGRSRAADLDDAPPQRSRKLIAVAAAAVALVLVAGVAKVVLTPPPPPPMDPGQAVIDPSAQVQTLLSECRSYTSKDMGSEPQWEKAEVKCEEARVLDPINGEVNAELKRIRIEKEAAEYFAQGTKLLQRLKEEDAIDILQKIPKESTYYWRRAKIKMDEAAAQVNKRAEDDCKRYLRDAQWEPAVPRCERYMSFWCQTRTKEELEPPLGYTLKLEGRANKNKKEWQPSDKLFLQFLIARRKVDPRAEPWTCKAGYGGNVEEGDEPSQKVKKMFKERYPNAYLNAAMFDYWGGRANESVAKLQKVRSNYELASLHNQTDLLIQDVSTVNNLFKTGSTLLQAGEIEKAAEPFAEALDVDKRLMGDLWETVPSFYRKNIQQDMSDKAYERGRDWAKRDDQRRACKLWKVGFRFYKGNTDLIRVLSNLCSTQATKLFAVAGSCGELAEAEEWSVTGDGLEEKISKRREELKCK
ncbi:MAG TPA: FHA domain-containing protein [Hyalangium sp.]|jgi:pSer/pThr/pTyr-binding forkhead associated (FHA) protein|nr:FHA domain-containing protein [Hyalangium sp.]